MELDGRPLTAFATDKVRALLAYLVVQPGQQHRRDALAALLWPEKPQQKAQTNLRQALSRLTKVLSNEQGAPPFLSRVPKSVTWNPDSPYEVDVAVLEQHLAAVRQHAHRRVGDCTPCRERLEKAVALYRGEFLAGLSLRDSQPFEEWRLHYQERLHQQIIESLVVLARYYEQQGDCSRSLRYARRQLELEPWCEEAHRRAMRLLARSGQRGAALEQYQCCRRIIEQELGTRPEDATVALYQRIRAGGDDQAQASRQHPPGNLPALLVPFFGREEEMARIAALLAHTHGRLLTVTGPGGVGKTRLALQAAAAQQDRFPDGAWFVPLETASSMDGLILNLALALGLSTADPRGMVTRLVNYLRPRTLLLVLDNLEQLLVDEQGEEAGRLLLEILEQSPNVRMLVTSRERLNCQAEHLIDLQGLPFSAGKGSRDAPDSSPAVRLFLERAGRVRPDLADRPKDLATIARVCRLLAGLPLGIELAAAWAGERSCTQIAQAVAKDLDRIAVTLWDVPARHRGLHAVFEHSWKMLSTPLRDLYARLSVFQGPFSLAIAQTVAAATPMKLQALAIKSLLRCVAPGRYHLHPFLQQYAAAKLSTQPEAESAVRTRHARVYLDLLHEWGEGIRTGEGMERMRNELGNVRPAWEWAVEQGWHDELAAGRTALRRCYTLVGLFREGEAVFRDTVERLAAPGQPGPAARLQTLRSHLLAEQAHFLARQSRYEEACQVAQSAIALAEAAGDRLAAARAYAVWGDARYQQGDYSAAQLLLERALGLAQEEHEGRDPHRQRKATGTVAMVQAQSLSGLAAICRLRRDYTSISEVFRVKPACRLNSWTASSRFFRSAVVNFQEKGWARSW